MKRVESHSDMARRLTRVLLVDDERMVLRAMRRVVLSRHPDWDVLCALNADEALRLLVEYDKVDVMVTDLSMPGLDGVVLLNIVKERYPQVVRIVHSAHIEAFDPKTVGELCFEALAKPASAVELVGTLEVASGNSQGSMVAG